MVQSVTRWRSHKLLRWLLPATNTRCIVGPGRPDHRHGAWGKWVISVPRNVPLQPLLGRHSPLPSEWLGAGQPQATPTPERLKSCQFTFSESKQITQITPAWGPGTSPSAEAIVLRGCVAWASCPPSSQGRKPADRLTPCTSSSSGSRPAQAGSPYTATRAEGRGGQGELHREEPQVGTPRPVSGPDPTAGLAHSAGTESELGVCPPSTGRSRLTPAGDGWDRLSLSGTVLSLPVRRPPKETQPGARTVRERPRNNVSDQTPAERLPGNGDSGGLTLGTTAQDGAPGTELCMFTNRSHACTPRVGTRGV